MVGDGAWTLGLELGPVGRALRIAAGLVGLAFVVRELVRDGAGDPLHLGVFALYVAGIAIVYWIADAALGRRVLARMDPWFAALVYLGPAGVAFTFDLGPELFRDALGAYISASVVLAGIIGYGGCEVVAPPLLVHGRPYAAYCPWNAWDAVERPLVSSERRTGAAAGVLAIIVITAAAYFYVGDGLIELLTGGTAPWTDRAAIGLLVPSAVLAGWAVRLSRLEQADGGQRVRSLLLAALWLGLLGTWFAFHPEAFWLIVLGAGVAYAVVSGARRRTGEAGP